MYLGEPVTVISFGQPCEVCGAPSTVCTTGEEAHYYCGAHNPLFPSGMVVLGNNVGLSTMSSLAVTKSEVWAAIERFRVHLRSVGRESDDDVVLDLMDYLAGWCGPIPGRGTLK